MKHIIWQNLFLIGYTWRIDLVIPIVNQSLPTSQTKEKTDDETRSLPK